MDTTDPSDIFTIQRAAPKWVEGINGRNTLVAESLIGREFVRGISQGAKIEGAATNNAYPSFGFSIGGTDSEETSISTGAGNFYEYTENSGSQNRFFTLGSGLSGTQTVLILARPKSTGQKRYLQIRGTSPSLGASFNLEDESVITSTGVDATIRMRADGAYVCIATMPAESSAIVVGLHSSTVLTGGQYTGDGVSGMMLGFANLFPSGTPSSPILTTDSPVSRPADRVFRILGEEFDVNNFTLLLTVRPVKPLLITQAALALNTPAGSSSERIYFYATNTSNSYQAIFSSGGNTASIISDTPVTGLVNIGFTYDGLAARLYINGLLAGEVENPPISQDLDRISLGNLFSGNAPADGLYETLNLMPGALSASEMQELTAL